MRRSNSAYTLAFLLGALTCACSELPEPTQARDAGAITGIRFLADRTVSEFARATETRTFQFPQDHGAHPEYRNEWWYFTGNLIDSDLREFGFELTFFRFGLTPPDRPDSGGSESTSIWMAHFAMTDGASNSFFAADRLARGNPSLAYASPSAFEVRIEDWSAEGLSETGLRLFAADAGYELDLELDGLDAIMLQGDQGLDQKGPEPGNASYYYSAPRLTVSGRISTPDLGPFDVSGLAWLDREWGTSALSPGVAGWDWFALQLSDGTDLMYYRLRDENGQATEFSGGSLRAANGDTRELRDVHATATAFWTSPATGVRYPVAWALDIPEAALELAVTPLIEDQELNLAVRYWEGAVRVSGTGTDGPLDGFGYLELAGY